MDTARPDPPQPQHAVRVSFGALLRRYRLAAGLSQEELAERAGMSAKGLGALENGRRQAPYRPTVALLARALGLPASDAAALEAAVVRARAPAPTADPAPTSVAPAASSGAAGGADREAASPGAGTLPSGTLTFLLTDIEGSTPLWERHPTAMQRAIARHDALMEELLARYGGRQVKERGEGDSIFAVFSSPSAALAAVCALQQALLAEPWPPEAPLRVRMGLHTGEASLREGDYYGVSVNRTARIRSLAHGGQVLLSRSTHDLLRDGLPEGVGLRPLGPQVLKGLERPEEVFQVLHPHLPADFPPLPAPLAPATNLPVQPTSFIGRAREQAEVRLLLGAAPLVTLTGTGGAGKTRLALEVAAGLVAAHADGVWLVEFAALADPALVPQAVAQALGLREEPGRPLLATLTAHLQPKALLLVLDNCEHLIGACAELATALLRACPQLRLLATSRAALEVPGETLYRVPSLAAPDPDQLPPPEQLPAYEAVQLFVARARARRSDFALTARNAPAVAAVCARLDGMPLALELAAARVSVLPVEGIAARLDDRFRLLTGGPRTALPRQQTLRATLDWSYDLLSESERWLLERLSVFAGGWTLDAAEAVGVGVGSEGSLRVPEVLDLLGGLVNKSLVQAAEADGELRYGLLETVRQYGQERLAATDETEGVRDRHLGYYLALAEEAEPALKGATQGAWLGRLEAEHDNLRAALSWARAAGEAELGLRLAGALWRFWGYRGYFGEGRSWLEAALAEGGPAPTAARAKALNGAGNFAFYQDDYGRAAALYEEGLALQRALGDTRGIAGSLGNLANVAFRHGDYGRVAGLYEESLALFREAGDRWGIAHTLDNLGTVARQQGNFERAVALHMEGLVLKRVLGDTRGIAASLFNLGHAAYTQSDYPRAAALYAESLALKRELGATEGIARALEGFALLAGALHRSRRAVQLWAAAEALRGAIGAPRDQHEQEQYGQAVPVQREALGGEAFAAAWDEGRAFSLEAAVALALEGQAEGSGGV
jgi:predicted ATPase/class 3 adenylate cyclase